MTDMLERVGVGAWTTPSDPDCPGVRVAHRTLTAHHKNGCRCPEAVAAHDAWLARRRGRQAALRASTPARVRRGQDPRKPWRGPRTRVDALVVDFLAAGYRIVGTPTRREFQVASWRMLAAGHSGYAVARALGVTERLVWRWGEERRRLRGQRAERRCADAAWRAWHKHGKR